MEQPEQSRRGVFDFASQGLRIRADHPGGNIAVEKMDGDTVFLRQDLRDTEGWWFYWNFRVLCDRTRTLRFQFTDRDPIGPRGPCVSADGGDTWTWLGASSVKDASFPFSFDADNRDVRFCFSIPYQEANLRRFLDAHRGHPCLKEETLCLTAKGRRAELLRLGAPSASAPFRVLITARHHACETIANFTLEGVMDAILADTDDGDWWKKHVELLVVPFVDKDGVEDGDQGKNRRPHDHNRDYGGESLYPTVRALRSLVPAWSQECLRVAMDLHCPGIRGRYNEHLYMVGSPLPAVWDEQRRFGAMLESVRRGPLPYRNADNLPFGQDWNVRDNYKEGVSFSGWAAQLPGIRLVTSLEIPYANVAEHDMTPDKARAFGRDLVSALRRNLVAG